MDLLWQQIIIGLALAGGFGYLIRRVVRRKQQQTKCRDCQCSGRASLDRPDFKRP